MKKITFSEANSKDNTRLWSIGDKGHDGNDEFIIVEDPSHVYGTIDHTLHYAPKIENEQDYLLCVNCLKQAIECLQMYAENTLPIKRNEIENINESFNTVKRMEAYIERIKEYLLPRTK